MTASFARSPLLIAPWISLRLAMVAFVLAVSAVLAGCAGLPSAVQRTPSQARTDVTDTRLATVAAASMPERDEALSGLRLLPAGEQAFEARIALARAAQKSIDAQYYQIADDASGLQFLRTLAEAAGRGVRVRLLVDDLHAIDQAAQRAGAAERPLASRDLLGQTSVGAQLATGRLQLHLAAVRVLADAPVKAPMADGAVMNGKLELLQSARSEVLVASPYFVPGRRTMEILKQATDSQVRVSVMTNSLATTDEPLVHAGYARYRTALLDMGVSLYELMPGAVPARAVAGEVHGSLGRLHAKLAVVDGRRFYIGSLNMDRRSAHLNTEMGLIVDSPELAGQLASLLRGERQPRSYQVRSAGGSKNLQWVAQGGDAPVVLAQEPNSRWSTQLRLALLSSLIDEELL